LQVLKDTKNLLFTVNIKNYQKILNIINIFSQHENEMGLKFKNHISMMAVQIYVQIFNLISNGKNYKEDTIMHFINSFNGFFTDQNNINNYNFKEIIFNKREKDCIIKYFSKL